MMKKFLLALLALTFSTGALADPMIGGFVVPPEYRSQPGGGYVGLTPVYSTDGTANTVIDPNVTPAPQLGLTPIINATDTNYVVNTDNGILCPTTYSSSDATVTASIDDGAGGSGTTLHVTAISGGPIIQGMYIYPQSSGNATGSIHSQVSGTTGGIGDYTIGDSQLVASRSMLIKVCTQAKFRTLVGAKYSKVLADDPVRNYGQPGTAHLHTFFGNLHVNAYSTYSSLRHDCASGAAGYCANATGYWIPSFIKTNPFGDGHDYAVRPNQFTVYYLQGHPELGPTTTNLAPGLSYVFLYNMDDQWAWLQSVLDSANAASGTVRYLLHGRTTTDTAYIDNGSGSAGNILTVTASSGTLAVGQFVSANSYPDNITAGTRITAQLTGTAGGVGTYLLSGKPQLVASEAIYTGFNDGIGAKYTCGGVSAYFLKNGDGSDPFGGSCTSGADLFVGVSGPQCWNGTDLWSPGGYKHVIPGVWDVYASDFVCPKNYYRIPSIQMEDHFPQQGPTDYMNWRLSSDTARQTACSCTVVNGETFHTDWKDGWNETIRQKWEFNGIGTLNHVPHELNSSSISATEHLIGGNGDAVNQPLGEPNVNLTYPTTSPSNMFLVPTSKNGPKTMNMHM